MNTMEQYTPHIIAIPTGLEVLYTAQDHRSECVTCHQQTLLRKKQLSEWSRDVIKAIVDIFSGSVTPAQIKNRLGAISYSNYTSLKYWGIIEEKLVGGENKWCITDIGKRFYNGEIELPEVLWVFNDVPRFVPPEFYGRWVTIHDLQSQGDISRQSVVAESIKLDSTQQESFL